MPIYVYRCQQCGQAIERRQRFTDTPLSVCETCGGELRKVLQPVGIIFKGSGFYSTDHRNGGASKGDTGSSSEESRSSETKTEATTPSTPPSSSSSESSSSSTTPASSPASPSKSE